MSRAFIAAVVCLCVTFMRPVAHADEQLVTWTDLVNVTVTGRGPPENRRVGRRR